MHKVNDDLITWEGRLYPSPSTVVHTKVAPPLNNVIIYPLCFLTAYKMTSRPSALAGMLYSKNRDPYYCYPNICEMDFA